MQHNHAPLVFSPVRHRYSLAANKIQEHAPIILDVGGYQSREKYLAPYFHQLAYYSVNLGPAWYQNEKSHVLYDGTNLPFGTNSFPYVICVDSLEHVHLSERKRLIDEMIRVAQKKVVVVVPVAHDDISDEEFLLSLSRKYNIAPMPSLKEHVEYGLPTVEQLASYVRNSSFQITFASPRYIYWSFQMAMLINQVTIGDEARGLNRKIQEVMEKLFAPEKDDLNQFEAYRAILTIDKSEVKKFKRI